MRRRGVDPAARTQVSRESAGSAAADRFERPMITFPPRDKARIVPAWLAALPRAALGVALFTVTAHAAPVAGTAIDNTASASRNAGANVSSNTVTAIVQALDALRLAPDRSATGSPGATVTFAHRLTNLGNAPVTVRVDLANLAGDAWDLASLAICRDLDHDGVCGGSDVVLPIGSTVALAVGDTADFVVSGVVPFGAPPVSSARLRLTATTVGQGAVAIATDSVATPEAAAPVTLFAEAATSRPSVEVGEGFEYQIRVSNTSDSSFAAAFLRDALPPGFGYLAGTARREGAAIADPAGGAGPGLDFAIGPLAAHAVTTISYGVRVGAGASFGDAWDHAVARAGISESNVARARVHVDEGLFAQSGTIVGLVRMTTTIRTEAAATAGLEVEPPATAPPTGVAGVRVWLDDGTFAITDAYGRYSFTDVTPRTHALKVDPATLPRGARLLAIDHRDSNQPGLRFVDLTRGDLERATFDMVGDSIAVKDVGQRLLALAGRRDDLGRAFQRGTTPLVAPPVSGDARALPAQGITTGEASLPALGAAALDRPVAIAPPMPGSPATPVNAVAAAVDAVPVAGRIQPQPTLPLDRLVRTLDPDLGFVGIADFDTAGSSQLAIRVKGPIGTVLSLRVNGERVSESRVGMRVTSPESGVEIWEYVGIALQPGVNVLEVAPPHSIGRIAVRVVAAGPLARLEWVAPARAPADGHTRLPLRLRALDASGIPVGDRTLVTVQSTAGAFDMRDLDPNEPGVQAAIENGEALLPLVAPSTAGEAKLVASVGRIEARSSVRFVPDLRPLLAVGAVEGVVGFGRTGTFGSSVARDASSFEAGIDQFASTRRDGRAMAAAHGAVFARGRVSDAVALTLGYDSDKPADLRRERDLEPEKGYPLFGDGATRGYDAQSTGRLYARLDKGESSVLYGDFVTSTPGRPQGLSNYNRSLTGAATHWEQSAVTVDAFTSRDRSHQRVEELRGLGISGPYTLAGAPVIENSERVEVVVRDRNQPAVVVSRAVRQRFVDYELEPETGRLTFRSPVPGVDANLDPVSILVTYETGGDGEAFWVNGAQTSVNLGPRVTLGGTYVDDHAPGAERELRGFSAGATLGAHSRVLTEVAATKQLGFEPGYASRFELTHESAGAQGRVWLSATGARFDNPGAGFAPGRTEGGARLMARMGGKTRMTSEALWSADAAGADRRAGLLTSLDRPLGSAWRGELGFRVSGEERRSAEAPPLAASVRSRFTLQMPKRPEWSGYAEAEQDVRDFDRRMLAVGAERRLSARGRLYARHELISSLGGPFAFNAAEQQLTTVAGIDADVARDTHVYSEYRLGDAIPGREAQAAVGLRNGWQLDHGVRLGTSFERVSAMGGASTAAAAGAATAASLSLEQNDDPSWKGSSRFEVRSSRASDSYLETMAAAVRLDSTWTALFRHHFDLTDGAAGGARLRLQMGAAYRPAIGWDALGRMEFRYDRDGAGPDGVTAGTGFVTAPGSRRRIAQVLAVQTAGKLDRHFDASVAWAGKLVREESTPDPAGDIAVSRGAAQWLRARTTLDLARGWDVGLQSSALIGDRWTNHRFGLGAEVGRQMSPGVWLSLGYNHFGYRDDELTGADWTRSGAYLRVRAKFDERLFGMLSDLTPAPDEARPQPAAAPAQKKPLPSDYSGGDPR